MLRRNFLLALTAAAALPGCATLQEIAALRSVNFWLDRITALRLAGVDLSGVKAPSDLSLLDGTRVAAAFAQGQLPLSCTLHLFAENPLSNPVAARLLQMQWTLLLEDKETISGRIDQAYELAAGQRTEIPVGVSLNLLDFFERSGQDLLDLALNLAGAGGEPKRVALRATPTIDTPLGPITYPRPITIDAGSIGRV
jgi:hypothetical protein